MSRFAVIYEDPTYEEPEGADNWVDAIDEQLKPKQQPKEDILTWLDEQLR